MAVHAKVRVRQAEESDAAELARLRLALSAEFADDVVDPGFAEAFADWWSGECGLGEWTAVVAESEGRLVADAWVRRVGKVPNPGRRDAAIGYLTNVYVEPAHRSAGLGSVLVGAVLERARQAGCELVVVWPAERTAPFYRRLGFAPPTDALVHDLG